MQESPAAPKSSSSAADLVNGGLGVKVPVHDAAGQTTAFVRYQDRVHGYLNCCAHVGVELTGRQLLHPRGRPHHARAPRRHPPARHRPCAWAASKNGRLTALDVQERDGAVYWRPAGKIRPLDAA